MTSAVSDAAAAAVSAAAVVDAALAQQDQGLEDDASSSDDDEDDKTKTVTVLKKLRESIWNPSDGVPSVEIESAYNKVLRQYKVAIRHTYMFRFQQEPLFLYKQNNQRLHGHVPDVRRNDKGELYSEEALESFELISKKATHLASEILNIVCLKCQLCKDMSEHVQGSMSCVLVTETPDGVMQAMMNTMSSRLSHIKSCPMGPELLSKSELEILNGKIPTMKSDHFFLSQFLREWYIDLQSTYFKDVKVKKRSPSPTRRQPTAVAAAGAAPQHQQQQHYYSGSAGAAAAAAARHSHQPQHPHHQQYQLRHQQLIQQELLRRQHQMQHQQQQQLQMHHQQQYRYNRASGQHIGQTAFLQQQQQQRAHQSQYRQQQQLQQQTYSIAQAASRDFAKVMQVMEDSLFSVIEPIEPEDDDDGNDAGMEINADDVPEQQVSSKRKNKNQPPFKTVEEEVWVPIPLDVYTKCPDGIPFLTDEAFHKKWPTTSKFVTAELETMDRSSKETSKSRDSRPVIKARIDDVVVTMPPSIGGIYESVKDSYRLPGNRRFKRQILDLREEYYFMTDNQKFRARIDVQRRMQQVRKMRFVKVVSSDGDVVELRPLETAFYIKLRLEHGFGDILSPQPLLQTPPPPSLPSEQQRRGPRDANRRWVRSHVSNIEHVPTVGLYNGYLKWSNGQTGASNPKIRLVDLKKEDTQTSESEESSSQSTEDTEPGNAKTENVQENVNQIDTNSSAVDVTRNSSAQHDRKLPRQTTTVAEAEEGKSDTLTGKNDSTTPVNASEENTSPPLSSQASTDTEMTDEDRMMNGHSSNCMNVDNDGENTSTANDRMSVTPEYEELNNTNGSRNETGANDASSETPPSTVEEQGVKQNKEVCA